MKTNSKLKLGILTVALALFPLLAIETAFAGGTETATGVLSQTGTGLTTFNLAAGNSTFQLDLNVTNNFDSYGITYFLVSNDASGLIAITARSFSAGSPYQDLTTSDAIAFTPANGLLDPVNNDDLGGTTLDGLTRPAGTYFINTLTLSFTGAVAGQTYTIVQDPRDIIADSNFQDVLLSLNTITIDIVPEPATTGLAVLGGVMLLGFIWKARRAMA